MLEKYVHLKVQYSLVSSQYFTSKWTSKQGVEGYRGRGSDVKRKRKEGLSQYLTSTVTILASIVQVNTP